ncbi:MULTISPECIES: leucine-rich repeat domain-containing protein [unclassified Microcoleus]|uniref:leucine-rich repeat domain-containing protein n=1 Tax=unclassified Microcoleus TaxID=2642155 RepID=UPI002FD75799
MSEKQPNEPMSFCSFADRCRHIDSLSEEARHTAKVLLEKAGTDDPQAAEQILSSMTMLDLSNNQITDFSFLACLTNVKAVHLASNQFTDISFLGWLTNLKILYLGNNQITDISFLGSLTNLTTLDLGSNKITDIRFLGWLTHLTTLHLGGNKITDISFLGSLTNLTTLNLGNNQITDISFLGSLTNLTTLNLNSKRITDIRFLGSLTNLTTLELDSNKITDISALRALTNLTTLNLNNNKITDISALRALTNLTTLNLGNNKITALCVLGELAQKRLTLSTKPIDGQKATEAIKVAYTAIGLEEPEVIICSSPPDACLQIFNLLKRDHSQNFSDKFSNILGKDIDQKWMSPVGELASPGVWNYELRSMTVESEADSTLSSLMYEWAESYVRSEGMIGNGFPIYLLSRQSRETPTNLFK